MAASQLVPWQPSTHRPSAWQAASLRSGSPAQSRLLCTAAALQEVCQRLLALRPENDEAQMLLAEMQFQQVSHSVGIRHHSALPTQGRQAMAWRLLPADGTTP